MIEFGGVSYYIDLTAFGKIILSKETEKEKTAISKQIKTTINEDGKTTQIEQIENFSNNEDYIDMPTLNLLTTMIDVLMDNTGEEMDTTLGNERALEKTDISFQIAFNTLYNYKILKEK